MTSIIKFTVLSGAHDEGPPCYLLQVDEFRFLIDCGWNETFNMDVIENVKRHIHQIDAILVTYPDVMHLGCLPYLVGKLGLRCPIYATVPTYKMGQMFMYDLYQSRHNSEDFELFTLDDIDQAFDLIIQVKYSQTVQLKGKGHGLTITPFAAGHMVGGTMWKIVKDGEEDIVYAVDYNHKKERHLDGAVLETLSRPSLLITDAYNALNMQARRKERDQALLTNILNTLRRDGNVLIAVDTAGRVLELAQLLDQMWRNQESGLCAYQIALLSNVSYNVLEFAKSQVEWMSEKIMRMFEDVRTNPFQFRHITLCHNFSDLARIPDPKAVLASVPDLECGFSRDLFIQWASNPRNSIILTSRPAPGCLARQLIDNLKVRSLDVEIRKRVPLEGEELETFLIKQKEGKLAAEAAKKETQVTEDSDEEMEVESSPASSSSKVPKTPKHDLMMVEEAKARSSFFKQAKFYPMFPSKEEKLKWDEYGEPIRGEDYAVKDIVTVQEEKQEQEKMDVKEKAGPESSNVPTKCIKSKQTIAIKCSLSYIDFEGLSDGESIKRILTIVKPRQLIVIHGTTEATDHLVDFAKKNLGIAGDKIFAPKIGECVDASTQSLLYQVKLKDSLMSSVTFAQAKDAHLAWVDGQIHLASSGHRAVADKLTESEEGSTDQGNVETDVIPELDALPLNQVKGWCSGRIFWRCFLVCNGVIALRKTEGGGIGLEGLVCEDYYKIRQLLYDQFAVI
ncbi:hypothetical protein EMCRGX_G032755 [Ephydatia muelleri]